MCRCDNKNDLFAQGLQLQAASIKKCSIFADEHRRKKTNISSAVLYHQLMPCGTQSIEDAEERLRVSTAHSYSWCRMQIVLNPFYHRA